MADKVCGKLWEANSTAFRCRTCQKDPDMSLCVDCFHLGNHETHDFEEYQSFLGGYCDCGDSKMMIKSGFCFKHGPKNSNDDVDIRFNGTCKKIWGANEIAFRCRTCSTDPNMCLCLHCFQKGNHDGHDFNSYRSDSGGFCDCGDRTMMNESGFCDRHGFQAK